MKYTKAQRAQFVRLLKRGKKKLWNGKSPRPDNKIRHVCLCIYDGTAMSEMLTNEIDCRLGNYSFVSSWLADEAKVPSIQLTDANMQAYRLRWMNDMIREFSR